MQEQQFEELEEAPERRESVFTLSITTLLGVFFVAILLCGLSFAVGFAVGRLGAKEPAFNATKSASALVAGGKSKPSAASLAAKPSPSAASTANSAAQTAHQPQPQAAQGNIMVEIAAVSSEGDASALVNALHKRSYAASARRLPNDSLIHVRIGPFASRNEANSICSMLQNDGYNAIVEP